MDISIDYLALLKQLHKIEHKHKSVMNVSDNDPDLIKLHDISHAKYWQNRKFPYVEHNLDLLRDCIDKGYSYLETAQIMGVSRSTVASYCYRHKIREQPCFKYVLSKDGHLDYYSATKLGYDYLAGLPRCVSNCSRLENHLKKAKGYTIIKRYLHWFELPDNCHYAAGRWQNFQVKHGSDSFVWPPAKFQETAYNK